MSLPFDALFDFDGSGEIEPMEELAELLFIDDLLSDDSEDEDND